MAMSGMISRNGMINQNNKITQVQIDDDRQATVSSTVKMCEIHNPEQVAKDWVKDVKEWFQQTPSKKGHIHPKMTGTPYEGCKEEKA